MKIRIIILTLLLSAQLQAQNNDLSLLTAYLDLKDALISNKSADASEAAVALTNAISKVKATNNNDAVSAAWKQHKDNLLKQADIITKAKDIEKQRTAFAELSLAYWPIVKLSTTGETLYYDYCPMKKSYWISAEESIKNPYYGAKMLTCGKVAEKIN
ncbi:DUF3347 domain-containing protein [Chryseotalea sanaruensis]|uniref:DUF3347 domain-containing protein n=1 Tax=Chryseotalea sanaruensis TaxID=2482724 RepID=A0A401UD64_9BACT|nr:DUF3347 domain-containing protein [Chryseotalea sanaruensis]GCC52819.1 DUF3347 domain-containing protein [Chryseotalea sanaruensis]